MRPIYPDCGPNIVTNTKKPLYLLQTRSRQIKQCFELKDGRFIVNIGYNYTVSVYNLLNPKLIDIYIGPFNNVISDITQLDDGILIFCGGSYIRLVQIESKSYKIIKTVDMNQN